MLDAMKQASFIYFYLGTLAVVLTSFCTEAEDPYRYFTWEVTYGTISPLGVPQQGILINGQFPGPKVECVTNDNIVVNVINKLKDPFLMTWSGIKQRKSSWQDGVLGTNCPIPPNSNWTYKFQAKDQIGTFTYFPSTQLHRASGGFGGFNINQRSVIPVPYPIPADEFTLLVGDWYNAGHKALEDRLDSGYSLPLPDGLLINGLPRDSIFSGKKGNTYKFRVSNVGISTAINFRIQGHTLVLVEVEGAHTLQEVYTSIDVFPGQSVAVLVTLSRNVNDYMIVASTRFTKPALNTTAILRYQGSTAKATEPLPIALTYQAHWSVKQARTIRSNLTANAARPNPQGSYHYGLIPITRTIILANSAENINGKLRYAVNGISYVNPTTPLKLADWFNISGVFNFSDTTKPTLAPAKLGAYVINTTLHDFVEIVFQNTEKVAQTWHFDGTSFYVVGYGFRKPWTEKMRRRYNLADAVPRHTVQVYPNSWAAILVSLDNKGMWNLRSTDGGRRYLGQELYIKVWNDEFSPYTENGVPLNALYCGKAKRPQRPMWAYTRP